MTAKASKNMNNMQLQGHDLTRSLMIVLGGVAVVITLIYGYPYLTSLFGKQQQVAMTLEQLEQRHLSLEQRVTTLTGRLDSSLKDLQDKVAALEVGKTQSASASSSPAVNAQAYEDLKARLDQMEHMLATRQAQIAKVPETIGLFEKFRDAMATAKPFDQRLKEAQILFDPNDTVIQQRLSTLSQYGVEGVPTIEQLQLQFKDVARELRRLSIPEELPWYSKFVQRLRSLIVVRRTGEELGVDATPDERVLGIQDLLDAHNLEAALVQANLLPAYESEAYQDWRAAADKRLLIEQSVPILEAHALAYLLAGGEQGRK